MSGHNTMWNEFLTFMSESYIAYGFIFFIGAVIGSFCNVVIYRLPMMIDYENALMIKDNSTTPSKEVLDVITQNQLLGLSFPSSHCFKCKHHIPFYYNIPIISYLLLKGKCFNCKEKFSSRYMWVELASAIGLLSLFLIFGPTTSFLAYSALMFLLLCGSLIDYDHLIIPDSITILALGTGLLYSMSDASLIGTKESIVGLILPISVFYLFFYLYSLIRGKGKFGLGDIKFIAAIGAWAGIQGALMSLIIAPVIGLLFYILMLPFGVVNKEKPIPFIPFMSIGFIMSLFYLHINGLNFPFF